MTLWPMCDMIQSIMAYQPLIRLLSRRQQHNRPMTTTIKAVIKPTALPVMQISHPPSNSDDNNPALSVAVAATRTVANNWLTDKSYCNCYNSDAICPVHKHIHVTRKSRVVASILTDVLLVNGMLRNFQAVRQVSDILKLHPCSVGYELTQMS